MADGKLVLGETGRAGMTCSTGKTKSKRYVNYDQCSSSQLTELVELIFPPSWHRWARFRRLETAMRSIGNVCMHTYVGVCVYSDKLLLCSELLACIVRELLNVELYAILVKVKWVILLHHCTISKRKPTCTLRSSANSDEINLPLYERECYLDFIWKSC